MDFKKGAERAECLEKQNKLKNSLAKMQFQCLKYLVMRVESVFRSLGRSPTTEQGALGTRSFSRQVLELLRMDALLAHHFETIVSWYFTGGNHIIIGFLKGGDVEKWHPLHCLKAVRALAALFPW